MEKCERKKSDFDVCVPQVEYLRVDLSVSMDAFTLFWSLYLSPSVLTAMLTALQTDRPAHLLSSEHLFGVGKCYNLYLL